MSRSRITVLVIEDHLESTALLHAVLEPSGIRVLEARSMEEAQTVLARERPDVILCDLMLPGEDGLAFIRWLRARPAEEDRRIPSVAITAFYERFSVREVRDAGFDVFLQKPLDPDQIPYIVGRLVAQRASGGRLPGAC
ncbi:MAG TPA: response regulator [Methylomirabilota bacterium]|jgi:CheY-like chemotaxis protein|nr:response regulator [Methylomirabilota bacterium]